MSQTDANQDAVERLRQLVASGLLDMRAYPRGFLHAKAYQTTFDAGWTEMVAVATGPARTHVFDEKTLRLTLAEIASRSHGDGATVN